MKDRLGAASKIISKKKLTKAGKEQGEEGDRKRSSSEGRSEGERGGTTKGD